MPVPAWRCASLIACDSHTISAQQAGETSGQSVTVMDMIELFHAMKPA